MAINKIVRNSITGDAIDATKVADDAISEEHLDVTAITGNAELSATAASDDVLLVYDTSAGALKKIQASNINSAPTITSISPTNALTGDGTGNHTFTITGTNFNASAQAHFINTSGAEVAFDSVTRNSITQITGVIAKSSLPGSGEPYDIVVLNPNGQTAKLRNQVNLNQSPVFVTAAGSLGTVNGGSSVDLSVNATDPESAGNVTFELQSGSLPAGLSLTNTAAEGGTAKITGTATNPVANTTTNFVLRAVDAASNVSSRSFSITVNRLFTSTSFTSSGTFAVPSGVTSLDAVLVVAGGGAGASANSGTGSGGGGAGGLIFMPSYPVTPGGTIAVTVGDGGAGGADSANQPDQVGQDSVFGASPSPGLHPSGEALTAKGGGFGGGGNGGAGGSSGGSGGESTPAGTGTQPTQSGDSGAYGFGNQGGNGGSGQSGSSGAGGGGGGAGAAGTAGQNSNPGGNAGPGGVGKAYTIGDGTTSVYYAGGGGGSASNVPGAAQGAGGQGGGTAGQDSGATSPGGANKGGGSGATRAAHAAGAGGKGIVIVRY